MIVNVHEETNYFIILFIIMAFFLSSCGIYKRSDVKDNPVNDADKRAKNINEGRGITFGNLGKKGSGQFDFATSNEMWRATLEILDFVPLANADYGGGIINTDWYSENNSSNESLKISVQFLSNEIRVDGIKVNIFKKECTVDNNCSVNKINSELNRELKLAILKRAAQIQKGDQKKSREGSAPYKGAKIKRKSKN